jgi:hypothetical protein
LFYNTEPISKLLKSVTPAKVGAKKRAENTGFYFSPELQQQTFEIGSTVKFVEKSCIFYI